MAVYPMEVNKMRSALLSLIGIASLLLSCSESVQPSISGSPAKPPVADMDDATMAPPGSDGDVQDMPDMAPAGPDLERGQLLYGAYCGFCHGDMGQGYVSDNANALANPNFLAAADDDFLTSSTVNGRPGTPMSAWGSEQGGPLRPADVINVVAYIRGWESDLTVELGEDSEGSAERGAAVYGAACSACHGDEGEGRQGDGGALSLNNPWFLDAASDGFIRYAIEEGRPGTTMGAYGDALTGQEIEDLVALIRSWQRPTDSAPPGEYVPDLQDIVINPGGDEPDFTLREGKYVPVDDVNAAMEAGQTMVMLDARAHGDFLTGHIVGAVSMPFYLLADYIDQFPRDIWIIAYCGCPHAISGQAWEAFAAAGFEKIAVLDEGYYEWDNRGYPVTGAR
jgi:cytochrome c oxidase cbb3-type subunit III